VDLALRPFADPDETSDCSGAAVGTALTAVDVTPRATLCRSTPKRPAISIVRIVP
jgi:hypothetical protein